MFIIKNPGIETLVEDWPGRLGYLGKGMSTAGGMDNLALRFANLLVGNPLGEACLEVAGGYLEGEFGVDTVISITGTDISPSINGQPVPMWKSCRVQKGDILKLSHFGEYGFRAYIGFAGGIDVPLYLGSKSTCLFGSYGGFDGRKLKQGDVLALGGAPQNLTSLEGRGLKDGVMPVYEREWHLRAIPGPNASPEYITEKGMDYLFSQPLRIQHSSNRSAYRLEEIKSGFFAREDGGVGGSHPSNIVDHAYAMPGALNICGNTPVLLTADGPTLGGYMCALSVIKADMWKIGQGTPSRDYIRFVSCTREEALQARLEQKKILTEDSLS
ncbi:MAG: biotin-dependent carboxyltransferase family protein [Bacillota bacterium]